MCCLSNSRVAPETLGWFNQKHGNQEQHDKSTACLYFEQIGRNESGIYTCKSEHEGQKYTISTSLHVLCKFTFIFFEYGFFNTKLIYLKDDIQKCL